MTETKTETTIEATPQKIEPPRITIKWLRFQDYFAWTRPFTVLCLGMRGSGKSSLLETLAVRFPKIVDLFGSSDNEGLCWCKPQYEEFFQSMYQRAPKILLVTGKSRDVASKFDSIKIQDLRLEDFESHDVITTVHAFHKDEEEYFAALHEMTKLLWEKRTSWNMPYFVLIRESSNWIYSRMKITKNDAMAKADFIKSLREARHHGLAIGVDTIRWTSLDKEVRDLRDFIFIKRVGAIGLPQDLHWLYRYARPYSMMQLKPSVFLLTTGKGAVGFGKSDYASWHKEERENVLMSASIEVKDSTQTLPDERRYGIGDFEHSKMITAYLEGKEGMVKVAANLGRSSETVLRHIQRHNLAVESQGICSKCHHANGAHSKEVVKVHSR